RKNVFPCDMESRLNIAVPTHHSEASRQRRRRSITIYFQAPTLLSVWRSGHASQEIAIPVTAVFDNAALSGIVDIDQAESLGVSLAPLKVIHKRPGEIALYRRPLIDDLSDGLDVCNKILPALRIADAVPAIPLIVIGRPILGNIERSGRVVAMKAQQEITQPLREHLPAHRGI